MAEIFLSYAREDRDRAAQIAHALGRAEWSVWWDRVIPTDRTFDDVIEEEIDSARCVVVLWSAASVRSRWVRTEAEEGLNRGILVPLLLERVKLPLVFRRVHATDFTDWDGSDQTPELARLREDIRTVLDGGTLARPTPAPGASGARASSTPRSMVGSADHLRAALTGRFEVEHELGAGGMAIVYAARDTKHNRPVALKVMRPELSATLAAERFLREIQIAANLTHPNIVAVYDSGEADGVLYYVMPFIEGESLQDLLHQETRLAVPQAISIAKDLASGLSYAHAKGVVHRDLKPANIMLSGGRAMLADFGIARAVQEAERERLTGTGMVIGTPEYMSPEQAAGEVHVGPASDVYALGCVVFEMLGGTPPFSGATSGAIIAKHIIDPPPALSSVRAHLPPHFDAAVHRALAKTPDDRWADVGAFVDALTTPTAPPVRPAATVRASAPDIGPAGSPRPWPRPRGAAVGIAVTLTATLITIVSLGRAAEFFPLVLFGAGILVIGLRGWLVSHDLPWRALWFGVPAPNNDLTDGHAPPADAHALAIRRARNDRATIVHWVERLPRAERETLPDINVVVDQLTARAADLNHRLAVLDHDTMAQRSIIDRNKEVIDELGTGGSWDLRAALAARQETHLHTANAERERVATALRSCVVALQEIALVAGSTRSGAVRARMDQIVSAVDRGRTAAGGEIS